MTTIGYFSLDSYYALTFILQVQQYLLTYQVFFNTLLDKGILLNCLQIWRRVSPYSSRKNARHNNKSHRRTRYELTHRQNIASKLLIVQR